MHRYSMLCKERGKQEQLKNVTLQQDEVMTQEAGHQHPSEEDTKAAKEGGQAHCEESTQENSEEVPETECHLCAVRSAEVNRLFDKNRATA